MAYDNTNRGVAFVNDKKETDSHPDMNGSINVDGTDYWISAWWKKPNAGGDEFLSFSIKPKQGAASGKTKSHPVATRGRPQPKSAPVVTDDDLDIPF
jgi:hypothetical protein